MGRLGKILALLMFMIVGAVAFYRFHNPLPELARNLPQVESDAGFEINRRIRERFPIGTSVFSLQKTLIEQEWGIVRIGGGFHYVIFRRSTGPISVEAVGVR